MSTASTRQPTMLDEVKHRSGWAVFMGLLTIALGVVLLIYPLATATAATVLNGGMLTLVGLAEIVVAPTSQTPGTFLLRLLIAVLYCFTGLVLIVNPFSDPESLTLFVGWMLIVRGILAMVAAFRIRGVDGWGWLIVDSIANLAAGGLIVAKWPSSTTWAVGTLVGAAVLVTGVSRTVLAVRIRRGAGEAPQMAKGAT